MRSVVRRFLLLMMIASGVAGSFLCAQEKEASSVSGKGKSQMEFIAFFFDESLTPEKATGYLAQNKSLVRKFQYRSLLGTKAKETGILIVEPQFQANERELAAHFGPGEISQILPDKKPHGTVSMKYVTSRTNIFLEYDYVTNDLLSIVIQFLR